MKVLITGGAGFIGSHVAEIAVSEGFEVCIADDLSTGKKENVPAGCSFYEVDIGSDSFSEIMRSIAPDAVIHMAAQINVTASVENPIFDAQANILNTIRVLQLCVKHDVRRFIFASSAGIYGHTETIPVDETFPCNPLSPYGTSKLACEEYIKLYGRTHGLEYVILRNSNVYGPRQIPHGECGVCAVFTDLMMQNRIPTLYGHGTPLRDYIYVGDVARANVAALTHGQGETLNVSFGEGVQVQAIFDHLRKILDFRQEPRLAPLRPGEIENTYLANEAAAHALDWKPQVQLSEGLRRTVEYFQVP